MEREDYLFEIGDNRRNNYSGNKAILLNFSSMFVFFFNLLEREISTCWVCVKVSDFYER